MCALLLFCTYVGRRLWGFPRFAGDCANQKQQQKRGKQEKGSDGAEKVIVAVKASKEIPKTALVWSLSHVVQPGDCITLLVVVPSQSSGNSSFACI